LLERDVEEAEVLELLRRKRADVDRPQSAVGDELRDPLFGGVVVAGDEDVELARDLASDEGSGGRVFLGDTLRPVVCRKMSTSL